MRCAEPLFGMPDEQTSRAGFVTDHLPSEPGVHERGRPLQQRVSIAAPGFLLQFLLEELRVEIGLDGHELRVREGRDPSGGQPVRDGHGACHGIVGLAGTG